MKVATTRPTLPMTYHEYALLPRDRNRYEVIDGELYVTPSPSVAHQLAVGHLAMLLGTHVDATGLGRVLIAPLDVLLSETTIVQPDALFLSSSKIPSPTVKNIQVAPDLVIEVLSESTAEQDRVHKKRIYARHGIPQYWIVDPENRTLEVFELAGSEYRLAGSFAGDTTATSSLFPGLEIPLARLWAA
jgi:Uma2 family endonuclease